MGVLNMRSFLCRGLLVLLAALPLFASAQTAHQVVQQTTDQLLADLKTIARLTRATPTPFMTRSIASSARWWMPTVFPAAS